MATPFKEFFNRELVERLGDDLRRASPAFPAARFVREALAGAYAALSLKERMERIAAALSACLPPDFALALSILQKVSANFPGLAGCVFPEFVAQNGLSSENLAPSLEALAFFTVGSSSEFGVRPFLRDFPQETLARARLWAQSPLADERRLASEGTRPRLPWGGFARALIADPRPCFDILGLLMEDPALYVRTSVANNLNDISKDHPGLFRDWVKEWKGRSPESDWILKKGARTLIKAKDPRILKLFGYGKASDAEPPWAGKALWSVSPASVKIGGAVKVKYRMTLREKPMGLIRLECLLKYPAGARSPKLFFLGEKARESGETVAGERRMAFRHLSVRRQIPGRHELLLLVNGREAGKVFLDLFPE
ncbi:MAG: hypothetical protein LBO66_03290 [Deltaproteobacteria bacterium]|jgi:3-methyladenine DNA glycosylase AlkC|nr:hypothetical protein [Deltaproteobacteria bacterium]